MGVQALDDGSPIDVVTMPVAKHLSSDDEEDERGFWHLEVEVQPEAGVRANGCGFFYSLSPIIH